MEEIIERYADGRGVVNTEKWGPDPQKEGYLKYEGQFTVKEVYDAILQLLPEHGIDINYGSPGGLEYFSSVLDNHGNQEKEFPRSRWIACYVVTGGSEGHYIHVDSIDGNDKREMVFLGKSLCGREEAEHFCTVVARILET